MEEDLPSIASLRAFVRAAETLSFKEAAAALHVSASALSRQVQSLEEHLGVTLFARHNPGIELTRSGQQYRTRVAAALRTLREAQIEITTAPITPLRISALESFSAKWLVPHLPQFHVAHPDIEIQIEATLRYATFDRDAVDVAIRFGTGPWGDLHSEPIVDLAFFPVCSRALRDSPPTLRDPKDLGRHVWIHVSQVPNAWRDWARGIGHSTLESVGDLHFDHVGIALSAAETGQGVALSSDILCGAEIADGRLCMPFDLRVPSSSTYHFVCRRESLDDPRVIAFRDWLIGTLS